MTQFTTETIWSGLNKDLHRFIRRRVGDDHIADDILQDVFLRIHRKITDLNESDRVTAWVYRVARNAVTDYYRRMGSAPKLQPVNDSDVESDESSPEFRSWSSLWLGGLIAQLPETYQEPLRLAELEGLTQQAVANRLGLSLSGAKSRIQRGRMLLKGELERCCTFDFDRRGNPIDCTPKDTCQVCEDCESTPGTHKNDVNPSI